MKALKHEEEEYQSSNSTKKTNAVLFPTEITEDILSRLPVKSILRSKSVSKPWHSLINTPSFTKLQFSRATTALLILAHDEVTRKHHFLSAACHGGPVTHLMTVDEATFPTFITGVTHLNGLVCFTRKHLVLTSMSSASMKYRAFVINPGTRKFIKLPAPPGDKKRSDSYNESNHKGYLFGFDEIANEHKVLHIRSKGSRSELTFEFMVFSLSRRSWKKIDVELPAGFCGRLLSTDLDGGVCVNSVVHLLINLMSYDVLAFDFVTEKLSFFSIPQGVTDEVASSEFMKVNLTKIDGCVGLVLHDRKRSEMCIWLLQDYEKREWVKETVKFLKPWNTLVRTSPLSVDFNMDEEIGFSMTKVSENVMTIPTYNTKSKCFKSLRFTLEDQFLCSNTLRFNYIRCYVESIMAL